MKILITGGNGYIAKSLKKFLEKKYNIISVTRNDFDLTDLNKTSNWFKNTYYDIVIHTAIVGGNRLKNDDDLIYSQNIQMFNNLESNKHHFNKLISFGSGAEIFHGDTPYANSKRFIANKISQNVNFYNLRIFAVFDENELESRFIKANLLRYIKLEPMIIYSEKIIDFFYMQDLCNLVDFYIKNNNLAKELNCSYSKKYCLTEITNFINTLNNHTVSIKYEDKTKLDFYCDVSNLPINTIGLEKGIINTYNNLL